MIRIGSSAVLHKDMAIGKVLEVRYYLNAYSDWRNVIQIAIQQKQYVILTICINHNNANYTYPSDDVWRISVDYACKELKKAGGNKDNCRISLVNEPMKYISREQYCHLIGLAYPIVHSYGFLMGAGNEEFFTAQAKGNMYQYILNERKAKKINFDILDIHIQGSCNTPELTKMWTDEVLTWMNYWKITADCTEAFYADIRTEKGWTLLQSQLFHAERIGCPNFCNVFNNLVRSAFPIPTSKWDKLCFNIDGVNKSKYWNQWQSLMSTKAPIPNIKEDEEAIMNYLRPIIQQEFYDAMGWGTIPYHENTPSLPIVGRKNKDEALTWSSFDAVIETILKGLISGLKENGALPEAFPEPMNIKYNPDGSWNNNWPTIAKSGGIK